MPKKTCKLIIDGGNDYAIAQGAVRSAQSPLKLTKKTCIAKFGVIQIMPNQQVAISATKELETELQHERCKFLMI
ncbi:hypothetical protein [Scytonema sp. PCC 10023]|uniref:hypothetical protein n=1 Tax=Scytonema sp. PCC 10023 TaxID=1680591 RepID=UPI0039C643A4